MNDKQIGQFKIEADFIHRQPDKVAAIFALMKCVPVRAEMLWAEHRIAYTAVAEPFAVLADGQRIPEYELTISCDDKDWPVAVKVEAIK